MMSVNLNIKNVSVEMDKKGVFWNAGDIAKMKVITTSKQSLELDVLIQFKKGSKGTIRMNEVRSTDGNCPLCGRKSEDCLEDRSKYCKGLSDLQNKMLILQQVYDWIKKYSIYRLHFLTYEYDKFEVVE
ncbi:MULTISPECIES: hypothetical protein [Bacillus cereus group]|uniref:hypothetical protein n=2 Tax=Bacillus TaxID=1386 RepID=UPI002010B3CB|nr:MULTISPECIES: hypothetical protein [Bacillus cereus group]MDG1621957.1 hypothetical protein [Bacillus mobilis]MDX5837245.1 hypothetical protein [Bacillus cereus group sp. BfR-BA-01700]